MKISKAVKKLTEVIKKDPDIAMAYRANIAMAFVDECRGSGGFEEVPYNTLHQAANDAADRFLNNWCYDPDKEQKENYKPEQQSLTVVAGAEN